jgi:DNA-binding transcriptional regulator PaaX
MQQKEKIERISDYDEIELLAFYAIYCDGGQKRDGSVHIWEVLKFLQKQGISERSARIAIDYLKTKKYITTDRDNPNMYRFTETGLGYMKNILISKGLIGEGCSL